MSFVSKLKKKAHKAKKVAKKVGLGASKAAVKGGKIGTSVSKVAKVVGVPGADKALAVSRAAKADGRVGRQVSRGKPVKKKDVRKAVKNTTRVGMAYA